jgi:hypothetical protein
VRSYASTLAEPKSSGEPPQDPGLRQNLLDRRDREALEGRDSGGGRVVAVVA